MSFLGKILEAIEPYLTLMSKHILFLNVNSGKPLKSDYISIKLVAVSYVEPVILNVMLLRYGQPRFCQSSRSRQNTTYDS